MLITSSKSKLTDIKNRIITTTRRNLIIKTIII